MVEFHTCEKVFWTFIQELAGLFGKATFERSSLRVYFSRIKYHYRNGTPRRFSSCDTSYFLIFILINFYETRGYGYFRLGHPYLRPHLWKLYLFYVLKGFSGPLSGIPYFSIIRIVNFAMLFRGFKKNKDKKLQYYPYNIIISKK